LLIFGKKIHPSRILQCKYLLIEYFVNFYIVQFRRSIRLIEEKKIGKFTRI